ncbi:MAG: protein kinase [Planctomycetes bacterium]|nr:protein kinase [Planctomycetota bacterium]
MAFEHVNTGRVEGESAETRVRAVLAALEADHRRLALLALSEVEAAVKSQPLLAEPVAKGLFHVLGGLQVPSWGYWRGLLDAIRNTRIRVLRDLDADLTKPLAQSARLESLFEVLDRRVEPEVFRRLSGLLEACKFSGKSATIGALVGVPVRLRNFVAHQLPAAGSKWWKDADAALQPLLEIRSSDAFGLRQFLEAGIPGPWCVSRDGRLFTYNGLGTDSSAHYVPDEPMLSSLEDAEGGAAVLRAIALLAAKPLQNERDIGRWLRKLAPEEFKGVIVDDYLVGRPVGVGGFATVHVARQLSTGRKVALKLLRDSVATEDLARFQKDAEYLSLFNHPNVAQVLAYGEDTWLESRQSDVTGERWYEVLFKKGKPVKHWIALEWIDGESLEHVYRRLKGGLEPAVESEERALMEELGLAAVVVPDASLLPDHATLIEWMRQAANALSAVHATGLIHRDVKPSNLMVGIDGTVKLIDFGVARRQHALRTILTAADQNPGTMAYKAPEQLSALGAEQRVGPASDVYSLCASFYELFGRRRLFDWPEDAARSSEGRLDETSFRKRENKHRPPQVHIDDPSCGHELEVLVMGGLEPEPGQRPTAQQLKEDIDRAKANRPIDYQPPATWRRLQLAYRRHRTVANLVATFVVLISLGLALYIYAINAEQQRTLEEKQRADDQALLEQVARREADAQRLKADQRTEEAEEQRAIAKQKEQESSESLFRARQNLARAHLEKAETARRDGRLQAAAAYSAEAYCNDPSSVEIETVQQRLWDGRGPIWTTPVAFPGFEGKFALSPDGKQIVGPSHDLCPGKVWDVATGTELRNFHGVNQQVFSATFSPDGRFVLFGQSKNLSLWDLATGTEVRRLQGHSGAVLSVAISPDGRFALSGSDDNTLRLWELATGKDAMKFEGHSKPIHTVAFSPDGLFALSGSNDHTLRLWDLATGTEVGRSQRHTRNFVSVAFSPDGRFVLFGGDDGLSLCEVARFAEVRSFQGHMSGVVSVAISPDGSLALSGSYDRTVRLWDLATGEEVSKFEGHSHWIRTVAFSPDGRCAMSGSIGGELRLWDLVAGKEIRRQFDGHSRRVTAGAMSPDGQFALSGGDDGLRLWDVATGKEVRRIEGHANGVNSLAFSPDGRFFLSGSDDGLRLWDVATGTEVRKLDTVRFDSVAFSPDGRYALSGGGDTVRLWHVSSGRMARELEGHTTSVCRVGFSPDARIARAVGKNKLFQWEVATGNMLLEVEVSGNAIKSADFSSDGRFALVATLDMLSLWDIDKGEEVLRFHTGNDQLLATAALSPDGRVALSGSRDALSLWDVATGRVLRELEGHRSTVFDVAFSPDGRFAISVSSDRTLRLWDVAMDEWTRKFKHPHKVFGVAISPDGGMVFSGGEDNNLRSWSVSTGKMAWDFEGHTDWVTSVAVSPDGSYALSGSLDKTMRMWDVYEGKEVRKFEGHSESVYGVAFSPDGVLALSGSWDKTLRLWDVATGQELRKFEGHVQPVTSVAVSSDGRQALSGSTDRTVRLWDLATGEEVRKFEGHRGWIRKVAFSPDGRFALSCSDDKTLRLWDVNSGTEVKKFVGHTSFVMDGAFSPDGQFVLSCSHDRTLCLWAVATGRQVRRFEGHSDSIRGIAFSQDGRFALSCSDDKTLRSWDVAAGKEVRRFTYYHQLYSAVFAPDGRFALTGAEDKSLRLWDVATGKQVRQFKGHTYSVRSAVFSSDGRFALSGSDDKTLRLWDIATATEVRRFEGHTDFVNSVAYSPDGRFALSGSADETLRLWDITTAKEVRRFEGHSAGVNSVAFSPDGRFALSGSADETLRLWDITTAKEVRRFEGHSAGVNSVAFSPDGRFALSNAMRLWEVATGKEVRVFDGGGSVLSVAFSPDGRFALAGEAHALRLWDVETGKELRQFLRDNRTTRTSAFGLGGVFAITIAGGFDTSLYIWSVESLPQVAFCDGDSRLISCSLCGIDVYGLDVVLSRLPAPAVLWLTLDGLPPAFLHRSSPELDGLKSSDCLALEAWEARRNRSVQQLLAWNSIAWNEQFEGYRYREERDADGTIRRVPIPRRKKGELGAYVGEPEGHVDYSGWWEDTQAPKFVQPDSGEDD